MVGLSGVLVVLESLTKDQFVVAQPEGVPVHGHRVEVSVGVVALGLACGAAIEVPDWQF